MSLVLGLFAYAGPLPAQAGGVTVSASTQDVAASTATEITFSWTSSDYTQYATGDDIILVIEDSTGTQIAATPADCATEDNDIDDDLNDDIDATHAAGQSTLDITNAANINGNGFSYCVTFPSVVADIYSVIMYDSDGSGDEIVAGDFGAVLMYVGDDNDVIVTGDVEIMLRMSLSANVCDLGTISESAVATCDYTVTLGSTAASGLETEVVADQELTSGTNTITAVVDQVTVTASNDTEQYGIAVTAGASTTELATGTNDYSIDDSPILLAADEILGQSGPVPTPTATTIQHRATSANATEAGHYTQTVTYTTVATF